MTDPNPNGGLASLFKPVSQMSRNEIGANILIYGPPGAGKTHRAAEGGRPAVLLTERNGLTTIRTVNPNAAVLVATDLDTIRRVIVGAQNGELNGFDRLVIDSLTEAQRLIRDDIMRQKIERHKAKSKNSRSQNSRSGQDKEAFDPELFTVQDWGRLAERTRKLIRNIRAIPIPVIAVALDDAFEVASESNDGEATTVIHHRPQFDGRKTPAEIAQYFSAVGFSYKRAAKDGSDPTHGILFDGPQRFLTKSCKPGLTGNKVSMTGIQMIEAISGTPSPAPGNG